MQRGSRKTTSNDRLFSWQFMVAIVVVALLAIYRPNPLEFLNNLASMESEQEDAKLVPATEAIAEFEQQLYDALRLARSRSREQAHEMFQRMLEETTDPVEKAALLPRAADFYLNGTELSSQEIERLYQDALQSLDRVYSNIYYDYENVHRGLEKLYISQKRYAEAAVQTRFILAFYGRYYKEDDTRYLFEKPSTIRLANHLVSAGKPDEARRVYKRALEMTRAHEKSDSATKVIEAMIANIELPEGSKQDTFGFRLVAPPGLPPYPTYKNDVRPKIESIEIEGLTVERITENIGYFRIQGYAVDNTVVAAYLRELQESVDQSKLQVVTQREQHGHLVSAFSITVSK